MTVRELIDKLECFDDDMEVRIGMIQRYGSNFANEICDNNIEERTVDDWYNGEYKAVVITKGKQIGIIDYGE